MLTATVYPDADSIATDEGKDFEGDYVSFINGNTYGPPALIAPAKAHNGTAPARAVAGETVIYINLSLVPLCKIKRED